MTAFDQTRAALDAQDPLAYVVAARDHDTPSLVKEALAANRCSLAFQPVFRTEGGVAFYEGLIRVSDAAGRTLPARAFMSQVEETEIGRDLDAACLGLAFEMLANHPSLRLSINVSARSLADTVWRSVLEDHLGDNEVTGERLILEISERSAMLLPEVVARFMAEMQPLGVAFGLDDFGGGFTSFRHLRRFMFDLVKIDQSFVRGVSDDPDNQALVTALVEVAHQFEMFAIAPGIERQEDAEWLASVGVDCMQGYLLGVPKFTL